MNWASAQVVATSATIVAGSFSDGSLSTGSLTVNSYTGLSTAPAHGSLTILTNSSLAGVVASTSILISTNVSGTVLMFTGPPANLPPQLTIGGNVAQGDTSTNTAVNFAAFITPAKTSGLFESYVTGSSVTIACVSSGTFCNAYGITSSSPVAVTSATFVGGVDPGSVTVNTMLLRAGKEFAIGTDTTATALNLAAAINAGSSLITSTNVANVVNATATTNGIIGNGYGLVSYISSITVSGATMTGGLDNATVCLGATCVVANKDFYPLTSTAQTATNIVTAFNATAASQTFTIGSTNNVIGATSTVVGTASYTYSVTTGAIQLASYVSSSSVTGAQSGVLTGGTTSSYSINGSTIYLGTNTLLGIASTVIFSTTSGNVALSPLSYGSTYYVIPGSSGLIQLSLTSTGAVAGAPIVFTSSAVKTTADSFKLTPSQMVGAPAIQWVVSNDNTNWLPYTITPLGQTISSTTYTSSTYVATGTITNNDFGRMDYGYLGINYLAPTSGAMTIKAKIIGKE